MGICPHLMDDFHKERDENTMKNRTMLITAGFGLMMILSLFIGSVGAMAGPVGAPGAPAAGPITSVTITSPANNSYVDNAAQLVSWTVVGGENNSNMTRMWSENEGWNEWINVTGDSQHLFEDLAEGLHYVEVAVFAEDNNMTANNTFTVDTVGPVVTVELPFDEATNLTDFTVSWVYTDETPLVNTNLTLEGPVSGFLETNDDSTSLLISDVTGGMPLAEGDYALNVTVWDSALNSGNMIVEFRVGPTVQLLVPNEDDPWFTNDGNFTIEWTVSIYNGTSIVNQDINITNATTGEFWEISIGVDVRQISVFEVTGFNLSDGMYSVSVTVEDNMTFVGSDVETFAVDTVAPDVEFVVPNGEMNPWYTNNNNFTAEWMYATDPLGTPIATQIVTITNGTVNMTDEVDPAELSVSVFEIWGNVLADGNYTIFLNATDVVGNWENESANFVVDTVPPEVDLIVPELEFSPNFFNDNNFTAEWTIEADPMMTPITNITVTIWNGTEYRSISVEIANTSVPVFDVWGAVLPDGNYTIFVNVTDAAGNLEVEIANFIVDTVAPTVVIDAPTEGSFVNMNDVLIAWTAADTNGSGIEFIFVRNDTGTWKTLSPSAVNETLNLNEGQHFVEVQAMDFAGNSFIANVTFTVDLTQPIVEISYPANDAMFGVNHVTVNWNGSDALSGLSHFEVKVDDLDWENVGYNLTKDVTGLADGMHVVMVKAVDNATNENVTSVTFIVDTTAPWVEITAPVNGLHTNAVNIRLNWTTGDNTTDVANIHVWVDDGAFVNLVNSTENVTYMFEGLAEGVHSLHVEVFDLVGNSLVKSVSVVVDLTAPEIVFEHPVEGQHINDTMINATWIVTDNLSPIVKIEVAIDDGSYIDIGLLTYHEFADVAAGQHQLFVRATDSVGNVGTNHINFVVDRIAPTVVSHNPASGAIVLPDAVVKVNFSEPMDQASVLFNGITGTKTWNAAGNEVTLTHADLTYATQYGITVTGKDLAGNAVSASWTFKTVTQVTGTINDDKGNPIANATVTISQGGVTVVEGTTDANGHFALIVDGVGTYNITVSAKGFQNLVENNKALGVEQTNSLGPMAMTPNPDYTLVIVGVVVVVAIVLAALFLMRRKK